MELALWWESGNWMGKKWDEIGRGVGSRDGGMDVMENEWRGGRLVMMMERLWWERLLFTRECSGGMEGWRDGMGMRWEWDGKWDGGMEGWRDGDGIRCP